MYSDVSCVFRCHVIHIDIIIIVSDIYMGLMTAASTMAGFTEGPDEETTDTGLGMDVTSDENAARGAIDLEGKP